MMISNALNQRAQRTTSVRSALLLLLSLCTALFANQNRVQAQGADAGPIVREIEIQYVGPSSVSKERIMANMKTKVGVPYSEAQAEQDVRSLYSTQAVSNLRIFAEPAATHDGVKVILVVQPRATIKQISIQGTDAVKEKRLRKEISAKVGESLSEAALEQDRQKLLEYYAKKGYGTADIQYKVNYNEQDGTANVVFDITEGGKALVGSVNFEGNTAISAKELRKVMKTRPRTMFNFLGEAGKLNADQLSQDVVAVAELYRNKGYADVQVTESTTDRSKNGRVNVVLVIKEGTQYNVGKISFTGQVLFTEEQLRAGMKMTEGSVFGPKGQQGDMKVLQDLYGTKGYVDLQLIPETSPGGTGIVNIHYKIEEGVQSYVERVNIEGNTRTKDKVIRRELAVEPGDLYNTVLVDASRRRLENLNYFSKVEAYPSDTLVPGRKDLSIIVEEKRTGSFNFGAGFSSIDSLIGFAEVQQSNFDLFKWPNFTGGGQRFRTRVQYGTERSDFVIGITEPWFMDYQVAVGGELFYHEATYVSDVYDQRNYGFSLNARKPVGKFASIGLDYVIEEVEIYDVSSKSEEIQSQEGKTLKSQLTATFTIDKRDSVFLSRKGYKFTAAAYVAGGFLGGEEDILGYNIEATKYFLLPYDAIFAIQGAFGSVNTWNGGTDVPIFDRLYLGGANNLRGFDYREVGPKDQYGEPIGGNSLARVSMEVTFPIINRVRGAVFYDIGFVNTESNSFGTGDYNSDAGVGLRLDLPIGPVRVDFGVPIQADQYNDSDGKFNFNIGYQF